jgi:hypothetical protein
MSIRFSCSCGRKLKVSDERIGMKVLCSSCGATLKVPKKSQDEYWQDVPAPSSDAKIDYAAAFRDFFTQFLPGLIVLSLMVWGAYYLSSQIILSRGDMPPLGKVSGRVTLDGQPLPAATVKFIPIDEATQKERKKNSVSLGVTDDQGRYSLLYVKDHPGAVVGLCRIEVESKDAAGQERVPRAYNHNSRTQREVKSGSNQIDLELLSTGPAATEGATPNSTGPADAASPEGATAESGQPAP